MDTPRNPALSLSTFHPFVRLPAELRLKIYDCMLALSHNSHKSTRILKISFCPSRGQYISNTPPPVTLCLCSESRLNTLSTHSYLLLGPSQVPPQTPSSSFLSLIRQPTSSTGIIPIPISYSRDILYLSSLSPLLSTHLHRILYHFFTSPSRHLIQQLAIDFRVWAELCENGFLGAVSRMKALREVFLVVEFGRDFDGAVGFLELPSWRRDLKWVAEGAERDVRDKGRALGRQGQVMGDVRVRCVLLTRGGEQS
ncbi:hypothetical protein LZ554_003760 [Drepanopeziza brunnea f. sp. 'monogermtubi']|nr:hypothetical protein LZ554_003760 [Drepanopeziza brunnea f. sp. 'monogermtubi']